MEIGNHLLQNPAKLGQVWLRNAAEAGGVQFFEGGVDFFAQGAPFGQQEDARNTVVARIRTACEVFERFQAFDDLGRSRRGDLQLLGNLRLRESIRVG
jgi:hypothetical protein